MTIQDYPNATHLNFYISSIIGSETGGEMEISMSGITSLNSQIVNMTQLFIEDTFSGLSTLLPKPVAAPAAHSILKNGAVAASSYVPVYEKQKPVLGPGSASPYSTLSRDLSRPGSSMSTGKPEPTP